MKKFEYSSMKDKYFAMSGEDADHGFRSFDKVRMNPVKCEFRLASATEVRDWCEEQFGNNWIYEYCTFYFKREEDAVLFALKWG
jgi:hypothetical protein